MLPSGAASGGENSTGYELPVLCGGGGKQGGKDFFYLKTTEELKLKPNRLASQNSSYFKQVYGSLVMHQSKAIVLKIFFFSLSHM